MHWMKRTLILLPLLATTPTVLAQDDYGSRGNLWADWTQEERLEAMELGERFKVMIGAARSELMMVKEAIRYAEARGFVAWDPARGTPSPGDKFLRGQPGSNDRVVDRRPGARSRAGCGW